MNFSLYIANKFLRSSQNTRYLNFITGIAITGIAVGVIVFILAISILKGFEKTVEKKIISLNSHIKITAFGKRNLPNYPNTINMLKNSFPSDIKSISPFIEKEGIAKVKRLSEGITIKGITSQNNYSGLKDFIVEGSVSIDDTTKQYILIGRKLAEKLYAKVNDKFTIFSLSKNSLPSENNPPIIEQFIICGIYESGMAQYDDLTAYISLKNAERVFNMHNSASGFDIKLNSIANIDTMKKRIEEKLRYPYYVRTIYKVHHAIFSWIDLQKKPIPIVLGLIVVVAIFNIIATLLMITLEKTNAIGTLKAMGARRKSIVIIFIIKGLTIGFYGISIGVFTSLLLSILQIKFSIISLPSSVYFLSSVPVSIDLFTYCYTIILTLLLCFFASLLPSYIAAKTKPISAIKFD